MALKKSEYFCYAVGSVLFGGLVLGPLLSFYISRLIPIEYPPDFAEILFASVILSVLHVIALDRVSGKFNTPYFIKMLIMFNLMALASYYGADGKRSIILLVPGVLLLVVYWVCGEFTLALLRIINIRRSKEIQPEDSRTKLRNFGAGLSLLVGFVIVSSFFVDSEQFFVGDTKPILIRVTFMNDIPKQVISSVYKEFEIEALELPEIKNVDAQVGAAPQARADLARWYNSELIIQIALHEEWQTKVAKAELIARVEKLFHYPGLKIKFVKTVEQPVPQFIPRTNTALEFSPDHNLLKELHIDEAYLSEELAVLLRLAPKVFRADDLLNLNHLTLDGRIIPFGKLGQFNTVEVELDLIDFKPGSWRAINSVERKMEGYLVEISLDHLQALGLSIVGVEEKVKSAIKIIQGSIDQQYIGSIPLAKLSGNGVLLRDIATVRYVNDLTKPQGEEGKRYQLIWTSRYR